MIVIVVEEVEVHTMGRNALLSLYKNVVEIIRKIVGRYVDDFVVVHCNKEYLKNLILEVQSYLKQTLDLNLHPKKIYLQHYSKGIAFLGVTIKPYRNYICNRTKTNFANAVFYWDRYFKSHPVTQEALEQMRASINSYLGILSHYRSYNIRRKYLLNKSHIFFRYGYFTNGLKCYKLFERKKRNEIQDNLH